MKMLEGMGSAKQTMARQIESRASCSACSTLKITCYNLESGHSKKDHVKSSHEVDSRTKLGENHIRNNENLMKLKRTHFSAN